jgi:bile acid:Na+ symporter, BASS family
MELGQLVNVLNIVLLVAMMVAIGLRVEPGCVLATIRLKSLVARSLAANFILVPLITMLLLYVFHTQPMVSAGFLILAVCAGAPFGPVAAVFAKGDPHIAVGLMVVMAILSAVLSPILLSLLIAPLTPQGDVKVDVLLIVRTLLLAQILPLSVGLILHSWTPKLSAVLARPLLLSSNLLLVIVIVLIAATQLKDPRVFGLKAISGMSVLLVASLGIGWLCGGPGLATRKTVAVTTGVRNAAVALVIVTSNFAETVAVTAVAAYGLFSIVGGFLCAWLLGRTKAS